MRAFLLVAIFAAAGLAGCVSDDDDHHGDGPDWHVAEDPFFMGVEYDASRIDLSLLSRPVFDILDVEEVWVGSSVDGKRIHNAVYRPDTDEPVPVFVNFSPYWGDTAELRGDNFAQYMIDNFVPRGYAVVLSAVRGTGHSEGCFQIAGDLELIDSYDVIDHFAQQDWSNGKVAAGGKSYDSTTQNGVIAKFPHEALEGIFHVSGITDMYRYNYREGVSYANGLQFTPRYYATQAFDEYLGVTNGAGDLANEGPESLMRLVDDLACTELPEHVVSGEGSAVSGMKDAYWIERDWNRYIADSDWDGSVFFVHGFQDWNVKPDHILPFVELLSEDVHVMGWLHQDTDNGGHVYPMRWDWNLEMLRWMDHILKGIDTGLMDEPAWDLEGSDGLWREADAWPYAPEPVEIDGAVLATAPADAALRYSGQLSIELPVTTQNPDGVLVVTLVDVAPDGVEQWRNEAVLRLQYRDGLESPSPVTPGATYTVTAEFYPQDDVLEPGHQWVLRVSETSRYSLAAPPMTSGVTADLAAAVVYVPWAPSEAREDQPVETDCYAC